MATKSSRNGYLKTKNTKYIWSVFNLPGMSEKVNVLVTRRETLFE